MMNLGLRKRLGLRPSLAALDPSASGVNGGVPSYIVRDGIRYRLLIGYDGKPRTGYDGAYLYGVDQ